MKHGPLCIMRHAVQMVRRNFRSYSMLSVTIIMSFAVLFGYLGLMDTQHYNKYKEIFALDRNMVFCDAILNPVVADQLVEKAEQIGQTTVQRMYFIGHSLNFLMKDCTLDTGERVDYFPPPKVWSIPSRAWQLYDGYEEMEITWFDGKEHDDITLQPDEILVDDQLFSAFGLEEGGTFALELYKTYGTSNDPTQNLRGSFTVVGTIHSAEYITLGRNEETGDVIFEGEYQPILVFSSETFGMTTDPDLPWWTSLTFYTDSPEEVKELANSVFSYEPAEGVYQHQNDALKTMRTEKRTKSLICCVLLLLLGINLYSSFSNALQSRKFEIGVKRALGASAFSIVRQFLYESLLVLLADIVLAVVLVMDAFLVYKTIYEARPDQFGEYHKWVIYISPYSIAMFVVCSAVLTIVFSLIFAYKSTQVEVIEYLKAE